MSANETVEAIMGDADRRRERITDVVFEALLVGATLIGIVSLGILLAQIFSDAIRPFAASTQWFMVVAGVVVAPTAAYTVSVRRRLAARAVNARFFGVVVAGLVGAPAAFLVIEAMSPYDVLLYLLAGAVPPIAVWVVGRNRLRGTVVGPAIPVSVVGGLFVGGLGYSIFRTALAAVPMPLAYVGAVTVPVAGALGTLTARRGTSKDGLGAAGVVLAGALAVLGAAIALGFDPGLAVVLFSLFAVPVGTVLVRTLRDGEGRIGLLGPIVLGGGLLAAVALESVLGLTGPDTYLGPSLFLNSWHGLDATQAGVHPQLVGSIIIVGFMAVMAFPIGVGAAIYLEEYAPASGWGSRLASILEVNISNLAGVPSVVYGLLGLALFRNTLGFGTGIVLSAAGTLGLLILPIVVVSAQEAIRAVPDSLREASYGMGASRWQTLRTVVLPRALPGVLTGTILALARAIGETAPLVIIAVATTTYSAPGGLFDAAAALPLQIFAARSNVDPGFRHGVVPATAVILIVLMLLMNAAAIYVRNRFEGDQ